MRLSKSFILKVLNIFNFGQDCTIKIFKLHASEYDSPCSYFNKIRSCLTGSVFVLQVKSKNLVSYNKKMPNNDAFHFGETDKLLQNFRAVIATVKK